MRLLHLHYALIVLFSLKITFFPTETQTFSTSTLISASRNYKPSARAVGYVRPMSGKCLFLLLLISGIHPNPGPVLRFGSVNCNSITNKMTDIQALVVEQMLDVLMVQESKLDGNILDRSVSLPGFTHFRADRNRDGGGVITYAATSLHPTQSKAVVRGFEAVSVDIRIAGKTYTFANTYCPPKHTTNQDLHEDYVDNLVNFLSVCDLETVLLCGDFNCDYREPGPSTDRLVTTLEALDLQQSVNFETHGPKTIDHVWVGTDALVKSVTSLPNL